MFFLKDWSGLVNMTRKQVVYFIVIDISLGSIATLTLLGLTIYIALSSGYLWWLMFLTLIPMVLIILIESLALRFLFRYYHYARAKEEKEENAKREGK